MATSLDMHRTWMACVHFDQAQICMQVVFGHLFHVDSVGLTIGLCDICKCACQVALKWNFCNLMRPLASPFQGPPI